jgi:hypothetical protein
MLITKLPWKISILYFLSWKLEQKKIWICEIEINETEIRKLLILYKKKQKV